MPNCPSYAATFLVRVTTFASVALLLGAGCGEEGEAGRPDAAPPPPIDSTTVAPDAPSHPDAAVGTSPVADMTDGTFALNSRLRSAGAGTSVVGDIHVTDNLAFLDVGDQGHAGFVYQAHLDFGGYDIYDLVSIADDGSELGVTYLYCQGDDLVYVYTETFAQPLIGEATSGSCQVALRATSAHVALPALQALPPGLDTGIAIDGPNLELHGDRGEVTLAGESYELLPFGTVNCSGCPDGPWLELHSLLVNDGGACFGIIYLFPDHHDAAQLDYTICLPSLVRRDAHFDVSWSGALHARSRAADGPVIRHPRPPPRGAGQPPQR
jgi:hypothetical protein